MDLAAREQRLRQIQACGKSVTGKFGWGAGVLALIAALWWGIGHKAAPARTAAVEQRSTSSERISATFGKLGPGIGFQEQKPE